MQSIWNLSRIMTMALAVTVTAMVAGCAGATPISASAPAHPVPVSADPMAATASLAAGSASALPEVFAASFSFLPPNAGSGDPGERIALLSARNGDLLRWLTPRQDGTFDAVLSVHDGWVYFLRDTTTSSIWRVPVTGGRAKLVKAGATAYAISPDGHAVAYVISADHGDVLDLVARNLVTGRQNTIVMSTKPAAGANNWPPDVSRLSWAPDDTHLAVEFGLTAAISSVLVFDAFTATTLGDGRTAPTTTCPVTGKPGCQEFDPAYLASGALTYLVQRIAASGTASASLVAWQADRRTTLLSFTGGVPPFPEMTAAGQAVWVGGPAELGGSRAIWRWSGGAPVKVTALPPQGVPPSYAAGPIAW